MTIPYIILEKTLTFYVGGQPYQVSREVPTWSDIVAELNSPTPDTARMIELSNVARKIEREFTEAIAASNVPVEENYLAKGVISVTREGVTFNGIVIHGVLSDLLMGILHSGLRLGPWVRFVENLFMNPAEHAREELYLWLAKADLPITEDGHFLAYKRVSDDFKDLHTRTFDNSPGQIVQLEGRSAVDPDRDRTCSHGLHFCSKEYLPHFGSGGGNKVVIVKINPADVVSIPSDYDNTKGRTWRYEVIEEIDASDILNKSWAPVYTAPVEEEEDEVEDEVSVLDAILAFNAAGYKNRQDRLDRASEILGETVYSFNDLYADELAELVEAVQAEKVETDDTKERVRFASLGIIALRQAAAQAARDSGYPRTSYWVWKEASKADLVDYLVEVATQP